MTDINVLHIVQADNVAADLLEIIKSVSLDLKLPALNPDYVDVLMERLIMYLVERDYKILTHGYEAGRASA